MEYADWSRYDLRGSRGLCVGPQPRSGWSGTTWAATPSVSCQTPNDLQAALCLRCRRRLARLDAAPGALPCPGRCGTRWAPWSPRIYEAMAAGEQVWAGRRHSDERYRDHSVKAAPPAA